MNNQTADISERPALTRPLVSRLHFTVYCLQGGYAGNAAGMKISSLHKLTDIRSNKPGMNLLHYVAQQAEQTQPELLSVVEDLAVLEEASK